MHHRLIPLFALAVTVSSGAIAQEMQQIPVGPQQPIQQLTTAKAVVVDTRQFLPQVNVEKRDLIVRPENPFKPPWREMKVEPNSLPVGEVQDYQRIELRDGRALFPGIGYTGWIPPDPDIGVGPNHILGVVNVDLAFFTHAGSKTFQQPISTFFASVGAGPTADLFDPKVFFDRIHQRFVVVCLEMKTSPQTSKVLFGVSDDADPNGTWYLYRFEAARVISGSNTWADYPGAGYNKDAYVVSMNQFTFSGFAFRGVQFIVIRKSTVLSGGAATTHYFLDTNEFGAQVAEMVDSSIDRVYTASDFNSGNMKIHAFRNLTTTPLMDSAFLAIPSFTYPSTNATSPGGRSLDVLDGRLINVVFRNGKMVTAHGVRSPTSSDNVVRWYELNTNNYPSSAMTVAQSGNVAGTAGQHYFMPALFINEFGDISMIFTRSSSTIVADIMVAGRKTTDAPGTMGAPVLLESASGSTYGFSGFNRWGDYFGIETNPNNETTFWGVGMTGTTSSAWRTAIRDWNVTLPVTLNSVTLNSSTVIGGNSVGGQVNMSGNAPSGGYVVSLSSNVPAVATVPSTVTVPSGSSTAGFTVSTSVVSVDTAVTITASFRGTNRTVGLTVQWAWVIVNPSSFAKVGIHISGNLNSLIASDDDRMRLGVDPGVDQFPPVQLFLSATAPVANPSKLEFTLETRASTTFRGQRLMLFNWATNRYDTVDYRFPGLSDSSFTVSLTSSASDYIRASDRLMRAYIAWDDLASEVAGLWNVDIDQSNWKIFR